ncbi:MAG: preprotein translocase subunit SecY [Clostridiales bacterium]|nr:preprotein translocase subunit SecY [Clostridiales bacterium]
MFKTLRNAWAVPELRKRILFTLFIIVLYRLGSQIPVPYVDADRLAMIMQSVVSDGSILEYLNMIGGNAFSRATLFALSISPYITASIVMQLLTIALPPLERLSKEGEEGRKKINQITRIVTVVLGVITAYGYYTYLRASVSSGGYDLLLDTGLPDWFMMVVIIACYSAGAALIMWLAEKINEHGIGNGISIILFANIISRGPDMVITLWNWCKEGAGGIIKAAVAVLFVILAVGFVVFVTNSERRISVQYAKKVVGRKMFGGQSTNLPIKLNMSGVMPIIFANSIVALPGTIAMMFGKNTSNTTGFLHGFLSVFNYSSWIYVILFTVLIVAFSFFYIAISFNPVEVANNLRNNGGFVPGIRPGKPTSDYISKILNKITLMGAIFLSIVAVLPLIANIVSGNTVSGIAFSGSSLLIVVGVALETFRELEAQMTMRHYKGFLE